jgi:hypothetical protein
MFRFTASLLLALALLTGLSACDRMMRGPDSPMQQGGGDAPGDLPG